MEEKKQYLHIPKNIVQKFLNEIYQKIADTKQDTFEYVSENFDVGSAMNFAERSDILDMFSIDDN